MSYYRLSHIDLSERFDLALEMLSPWRPWGQVTLLASTYQVSRKFLYELSHKAEVSILAALSAHPPGPKPEPVTLTVDREHLQRSIVTLATNLPASIRGIQTSLEEILKTHRSIGFISQTLKHTGKAASYQNQLISPSEPILGEADEIFQGRHPCLTVVDGKSFAVLQLSPQESRDATTWGVTFLELQEQGVQFHDLACDGARGIRAGIQQAGLPTPLRPDLFHLLQEARNLSKQLESDAYGKIKQAERARRADKEAHAPIRRRGKPLEVDISVAEAEAQEYSSIIRYDLFCWLNQEIRQALEPWTTSDTLRNTQQAKETLETAVTLLKELGSTSISNYAQDLTNHQEELLAPLIWLEQTLSFWRQDLEPSMEATIIWAYKNQQALELDDPSQAFPAELSSVVKAFWEALSLFHRSSSLAESLHSWLRPYFQVHRGMPEWLTPLLQFYWNNHTFQRGKRKGRNPLGQTSTWSQALDLLLGKPVIESIAA